MDLVPCAHCCQSGTCRNGLNGKGCALCQSTWLKYSGKNYIKDMDQTGIVCSVCWGKGLAEPSNQKWRYRFPAGLAILIIVAGLSLLVFFAEKPGFDKIIVFVGTLVGSVTGYYFGGERGSGSRVPHLGKQVGGGTTVRTEPLTGDTGK